MPQKRSKAEFIQEASLSQQLADKEPIYQKLAGSDYEISRSIGFLEVLGKHGVLDLEQSGLSLMMDLLDVQRKAAFATSEHTNEITKMGLQMPRKTDLVSGAIDEDEES